MLFSAHCPIMLNVCIKYYEISLKVLKLKCKHYFHTKNNKGAYFFKKNCRWSYVFYSLHIVSSCFIFETSFTKISHWVSVLWSNTISILKSTKGHNSINNVGRVTVLLLFILPDNTCTKLYQKLQSGHDIQTENLIGHN